MTLAHAAGGHWIVEFLYVVPVFLVVVFISVRAIIDRRAAAAEESRDEAPPPDPPD